MTITREIIKNIFLSIFFKNISSGINPSNEDYLWFFFSRISRPKTYFYKYFVKDLETTNHRFCMKNFPMISRRLNVDFCEEFPPKANFYELFLRISRPPNVDFLRILFQGSASDKPSFFFLISFKDKDTKQDFFYYFFYRTAGHRTWILNN